MKDDVQPLEETMLETEVAYQGVFLRLHRDRVRCPDGREAVREFVAHPGAVVVLPWLPNGKLLFERQYRYPLKRVFLELPAGKIDPGEHILACAKRELEEETGYVAGEWEHHGVMHPCIGYSDERIEIFSARDLTHVGHHWDEGEFLEFQELGLDEAEEAVVNGWITDAKTITALFWARRGAQT